jgi:hypothetical protein
MEHEILQELKDQIERLFSIWRRAESVKESDPLYRQILLINDAPVSLCIYDEGHEPAMTVEGLKNQHIFVAFVRSDLKFIARTPKETAALILEKLKEDGSFLEKNFDTKLNELTCISMKRKSDVDRSLVWDEIVLKTQDDDAYRKRIQANKNFETQREDLSVRNDLDHRPSPESGNQTSRVHRYGNQNSLAPRRNTPAGYDGHEEVADNAEKFSY